MDFNIYLTPEQFDKIKDLDSRLGYQLWQIADMIAPYDTGNLRSAISLARNTSLQIRLQYNLLTANYIQFLEMGQGPVKKYKGFIEKDTVSAIIEAVISYLSSGGASLPAVTIRPMIFKRLGTPFGPENRVLAQTDRFNRKVITFEQRRLISNIRETNFRQLNNQKTKRQVGLKPLTIDRLNNLDIKRLNKNNVSQLRQIMSETRRIR